MKIIIIRILEFRKTFTPALPRTVSQFSQFWKHTDVSNNFISTVHHGPQRSKVKNQIWTNNSLFVFVVQFEFFSFQWVSKVTACEDEVVGYSYEAKCARWSRFVRFLKTRTRTLGFWKLAHTEGSTTRTVWNVQFQKTTISVSQNGIWNLWRLLHHPELETRVLESRFGALYKISNIRYNYFHHDEFLFSLLCIHHVFLPCMHTW